MYSEHNVTNLKDYVTLKLRNGSQFDVVGAGDTTRGGRRHSGLIDELRDHNGEEINSVVIPLLNVSRTLPSGEVNPNEKMNQQCVCMTSAGSKLSYAYNKLIDVFEESIIFPKQAFCFGCDYRVPMMHGLLNKAFINKLKMSPSFDERSFAAEYLSLWQGSTEDSWFNFDKMGKYRRIKNPEKKYLKSRCGDNGFYLISMDVGRLHDKSEVCVFRVNILNEVFYISLVNIITLGLTAESKQMSVQARDLKEIIERYNPKEVLIDCNGLGIGLADEMIKTHIASDGHLLPAYGFFNSPDYKKIQPKDAICILYSMKANGPLNSKIHSNCYSQIMNGHVRFLIDEQEAKNNLLATNAGKKMDVKQRIERLLPHEKTTTLFNQMANLRLKRIGVGLDIVLERINSRMPKDMFSAFEYGLWRIKELEEEYIKARTKKSKNRKNLICFTQGKF